MTLRALAVWENHKSTPLFGEILLQAVCFFYVL